MDHTAIKIINSKKLGLLVAVNKKNNATGIFTDGDLKRSCNSTTRNPRYPSHSILNFSGSGSGNIVKSSYNLTKKYVKIFRSGRLKEIFFIKKPAIIIEAIGIKNIPFNCCKS